MSLLRPIAMYLPQFHPIPENDEWWGKGFTDWTNVIKAKPRFKDHYQPHLPADLGFYDLRLSEAREAQANLARAYGIYGFCYYHYWLNGKQILQRPFEEVLKSHKPDFPFMLCWANENWTRAWNGDEDEILIEQGYSAEDDITHIQHLLPAFSDPRYIKVDGKAVFCIYRSSAIPDVSATIKRWRAEALKAGIQLYICCFETFKDSGKDQLEEGFDAAISFEPFSSGIVELIGDIKMQFLKKKLMPWYIKYKLSSQNKKIVMLDAVARQIKYDDLIDFTNKRSAKKYKQYPGAAPGWDNSARRKDNYVVLTGSTPQKFKAWLAAETKKFKPYSKEENFVFINAWNEWAEGCHLEPDQKWGLQYLEAVREVFA